MHCSSVRPALAGVLALPWLLSPLAAQTPIGGTVSGALAAGVYHVTSTLNVPAGQTWTLAAGVILKFTSSGQELMVDGSLVVNGTAASPVTFTGIQDDSAGGDTNGNGPSTAGPLAWRGIVFSPTSTGCTLTRADVRYGGSGFVSNVTCNQASPVLTSCVIRDNYTHGMNCNGNSFPTVTSCTFTGNGGNAVDGIPIAALPGFTNNTASGNARNYARVSVGTVNGALTIGPAAMVTGAIVLDTTVTVAAGATLTFAPGVVVKFLSSGQELTVDGSLVVNGTAASPVIFTGIQDDSAGGDTNTNGASAGGPLAWRGIVFTPTSTGCTLSHADVRYGGSGFVSNVTCNQASPVLTSCVIRDNYTHGMNCNGNSFPTVTSCTFTGNGGNAVDGIPIAALPGFTNNTASGNARNYARVSVGTVNGALTIGPAAMVTGAIVLDTTVTVAAGATLTFAPGVVVKFLSSGQELTVDGSLVVNGTAASPVIFTGIQDDSAGGDTNTNGASAGGALAWRGIVFTPTSTGCTLSHADVRYGGSGFVSNIVCNDASPTLVACVIRDNYTHGMNLIGSSLPTVRDCVFTNNGGFAVEGVALRAVPGFANNSAAGNSRNCMRVTDGNVTTPLTIGRQSPLQGALWMSASVTVAAAGALTLEQGVVFKFASSYDVVVDGTLAVLGTGYEPVVFTSSGDDAYAGDTDNNGPTAGNPASWRGVELRAGANALVEHTLIRYTGSSFLPALRCDSATATLRSVRVDRAYDRGFVLSALAGRAENLVAWGCGAIGIQLTGGTFDVVHATASGNGTGVRAEAGWVGNVINSIASGNGTNYSNFGTGANIRYSNGFPTGTGNQTGNPLFVDGTNGDLRLQAGSPCIDAADLVPALITAEDHAQESRVLDRTLVGVALPDMGAHEAAVWEMAVVGEARIGHTLGYTVTGPAGLSLIVVGFLDGTLPVLPWGVLLAGALPGQTALLLLPSPIPTGTQVFLPIPNDPLLVGFRAGYETLTFPAGNLNAANFTRLHEILVRP